MCAVTINVVAERLIMAYWQSESAKVNEYQNEVMKALKK